MARKTTESANIPWTDDELRQSVEVYVLLLRLQLHGANDRFEPLAQTLLGAALAQRNDAAIRYRMRNISAVVQELGVPVLNDFSPAESVGGLVRPKIKAMLLEDTGFARVLKPGATGEADATSNARRALRVLREHIEDLERELAWRGHNGPPDQEDHSVERDQLRNALDDITVIERELEKSSPDRELVKSQTVKLLGLAATFGKWLGERTTKFVDAALVAAAPIAVAKVTGLLPALVNAVEAVSKAIAN
ncbi:hypothetical protein F9K73_07350 [Brucella intermedia]|uniref:hypothetical protein n=1 Tax=Brucella intermedia TaxID=94625 RepID=UPI00124C4F43|nr:hypothetical protein [Brucella intermedia]KAB2722026.1 hypothetical protein F9K73_07350 [Brucella intermedia]